MLYSLKGNAILSVADKLRALNDETWLLLECELERIESQTRDNQKRAEYAHWRRERVLIYLLIVAIVALMSDSHHLAQFWQ